MELQNLTVVPVVKAYPALLGNLSEAVCVAGFQVGVSGQINWIRLFPIPFRELGKEKKFSKWQKFTIDVKRSSKDRRPESYLPMVDSIKVVAKIDPKEKLSLVKSLPEISMCELIKKQKIDGTSLGIVRPGKVIDLVVEARSPDDIRKHKSRADSIASQQKLFGQSLTLLQMIPHRFSYSYTCQYEECKGHKQGIIDWEIGAAYRNWKKLYPNDLIDKIKQKWLEEMCGPDKDTLFFVANMHQHLGSFLVLEVFRPKNNYKCTTAIDGYSL